MRNYLILLFLSFIALSCARPDSRPQINREQGKDERQIPKPNNNQPKADSSADMEPEASDEPHKDINADVEPEVSDEPPTITLEEVTYNRKKMEERLLNIPLYKAVQVFQLYYDKGTAFERAIKNNNLEAVREMSDMLPILASRDGAIRKPTFSINLIKTIEAEGINSLSESIKNNKKDIFDHLLKVYSKVHLYDQRQGSALVAAADLCEQNGNNPDYICTYFLNAMLDNKFDPRYLQSEEMDRALPAEIKNRVDDIITYNTQDNKSRIHALIDNGCKREEIEQFLKNKHALVDWTRGL